MSVTSPSPSTVKSQGLSGHFWWASVITLVAAIVTNTLVLLVAHAVLTVAPTFGPLQFVSAIPATAVAVLGAIGVFALLSQWSAHPTRVFRRLAAIVFLVSVIVVLLLLLVIGLYPAATLAEVGTVLLLHAVTALLCVSILPRAIQVRA